MKRSARTRDTEHCGGAGFAGGRARAARTRLPSVRPPCGALWCGAVRPEPASAVPAGVTGSEQGRARALAPRLSPPSASASARSPPGLGVPPSAPPAPRGPRGGPPVRPPGAPAARKLFLLAAREAPAPPIRPRNRQVGAERGPAGRHAASGPGAAPWPPLALASAALRAPPALGLRAGYTRGAPEVLLQGDRQLSAHLPVPAPSPAAPATPTAAAPQTPLHPTPRVHLVPRG